VAKHGQLAETVESGHRADIVALKLFRDSQGFLVIAFGIVETPLVKSLRGGEHERIEGLGCVGRTLLIPDGRFQSRGFRGFAGFSQGGELLVEALLGFFILVSRIVSAITDSGLPRRGSDVGGNSSLMVFVQGGGPIAFLLESGG